MNNRIKSMCEVLERAVEKEEVKQGDWRGWRGRGAPFYRLDQKFCLINLLENQSDGQAAEIHG